MSDVAAPHLPRLVLFPQDAESPPVATAAMRHHLLKLELISAVSQRHPSLYLPGLQFMNLITFLGCSPAVSMATEAEQTANAYFIEVVLGHDSIVAICGPSHRAPCCPECKHEAANWNHADVPGADLVCSQCGFRSPLSDWNWRRQAGFSRYWINIWGVFEGEALPGEKLLESLYTMSGVVWDYAWCKAG